MAIQDLIVKIGADISEFTDGLSAASRDLDNFLKSVGVSAADLVKVGAAFGAVGASAAAFLGVAVREAGNAAEAQLRLAGAIRRSNQAIEQGKLEQLALEMQAVTRFSNEAVLGVQRILVQFGATEAQVLRLTPLIADVARAFDRDLGGTAEAFGRAMAGSSGALQRFIGQLPGGVTLATDFSAAVKQLEQTFGGISREAGATLFDAIDRLQNAISNLLSTIGGPLLAPIAFLVEQLAQLVNVINDIAKTVPGLASVTAGFLGFVAVIGTATAAAFAFFAAVGAVNTLLPAVATGLGLIGGALGLTGVAAATTGGVLLALAARIGVLGVAIAAVTVAIPAFNQSMLGIPNIANQITFALAGASAAAKAAAGEIAAAFRGESAGDTAASVQRVVDAYQQGRDAAREFADQQKKSADAGQQQKQALAGIAQALATLRSIDLREFLIGVNDIFAGLTLFNRARISEGIDRIRDVLQRARDAAQQFAEAQREVASSSEQVRNTLGGQARSLEQIGSEYQRVAREAEIYALSVRKASLERAAADLSRPDLSSADLQRIENQLAASAARGSEVELRIKREQRRQALQDSIRQFGSESDAAREAQRALLQADVAVGQSTTEERNRQHNIRISAAQDAEGRITDIQRQAAQARIALELAVTQQRIQVMQATVDAARTLRQAETQLEDARRQAVVEAVRRTEDARLTALRERFTRERNLDQQGRTRLDRDAREEITRERELLKARENLREREVDAGRGNAERFADQTARERALIEEREAQLEQEIRARAERDQEADSRRGVEIQQEESAARIRILQAETTARVAQIEANRALREADLNASLRISQIETQAKIRELQLQTAAKIAEARRSVALDAATGRIPGGDVARRSSIIDQIEAEAQVEIGTIQRVQQIREDSIRRQIEITNQLAEVTRQSALEQARQGGAAGAQIIEVVGGQIRTSFAGIVQEANTTVQNGMRIIEVVGERVRDAFTGIATSDGVAAVRSISDQVRVSMAGIAQQAATAAQAVRNVVSGGGVDPAGLTATTGQIAAAYEAMAQRIIVAVNAAIAALQRLIQLQQSVPSIPSAPQAPVTPPLLRPRSQADDPGAPAASNVTIPIQIGEEVVGQVAMRFVEGTLQSYLQSVPTG